MPRGGGVHISQHAGRARPYNREVRLCTLEPTITLYRYLTDPKVYTEFVCVHTIEFFAAAECASFGLVREAFLPSISHSSWARLARD